MLSASSLHLSGALQTRKQVGTKIINPNGLNAINGVYPDEVYENFPVMLRKLALIYVVTSCIGALAIRPPPPAEFSKTAAGQPSKGAAVSGASLSEAVMDKKFWLMWFMVSPTPGDVCGVWGSPCAV